jgi:hypothetical protein
MDIAPNATYVLEFDYWASTNNGSNLLVDLFHTQWSAELLGTTAKQTVRIELTLAGEDINDTRLRFINAGNGTLHVSNVRFYNKGTVESGLHFLENDDITTLDDITTYDGGTVKATVQRPDTGGTVNALLINNFARTNRLPLKTDTTYVLEFDYWACDNFNGDALGISFNLPNDPSTQRQVTPTSNVQRARFEISSNHPQMLTNAELWFVNNADNGVVYLANLVFYEVYTGGAPRFDGNPWRYKGAWGYYWDDEAGATL